MRNVHGVAGKLSEVADGTKNSKKKTQKPSQNQKYTKQCVTLVYLDGYIFITLRGYCIVFLQS